MGKLLRFNTLREKRLSCRNVILKRLVRIDDDRSQRLLVENLVPQLNGFKVPFRKLLLGKAFGFLRLLGEGVELVEVLDLGERCARIGKGRYRNIGHLGLSLLLVLRQL